VGREPERGLGTVVALAGQVGGAKLADGLYRLRGRDLAVIANTGDDYEHLGLAFSPDVDTLLYMLSGIAGDASGWEPAGESHAVSAMLRQLGVPDRPSIGDKSLAAPILRTEGLRSDRRLTEITLELSKHLGIEARLLPMSDDPVRTYVTTAEGAVTFQDYFMQLGCEPTVSGFQYAGASDARISDEVLDALHAHDLEAVVICPANPYHVIRPILEIDGMKALLRKRGAPVIAVSPIVGGKALKGSAGKIMRELGREVSARSVAMEYLRLIDGFVMDSEDAALVEGIAASGIEVLATNTIMRSIEDRVTLAETVLMFAESLREKKLAEADF
jgi:LPPG:FO 2-phospho-L-lactate transferase